MPLPNQSTFAMESCSKIPISKPTLSKMTPDFLEDSTVARDLPSALSGRNIRNWVEFSFNPNAADTGSILSAHLALGNCVKNLRSTFLESVFHDNATTHQLQINFPKGRIATGLGIRFKLYNEWQSISYIAIGYVHDGKFRNIKITNPVYDEWVDFVFGYGDLAYGIQTDWDGPISSEIANIRVQISGTPKLSGARIDVDCIWCFEEEASSSDWRYVEPVISENLQVVKPEIINAIYDYIEAYFPDAEIQAKDFLGSGHCPLYDRISMKWNLMDATPRELPDIGTYSFSWHSLHPATILMLYARATGEGAALFAAREFTAAWMENSYFQPDLDKKYTWYDHGAAERLLSLLLLWIVGIENQFDYRFMSRLQSLIMRHAQLLESEAFYASHQSVRYHNHAWFQDVSLMAAALVLPRLPGANRWYERAVHRLEDQFSHLIVGDHGMSVFIENSVGYHCWMHRLVELAGNISDLAGKSHSISEMARGLSLFSQFLQYPDGRAPALGDTFRCANSLVHRKGAMRYQSPEAVTLAKAGYGVVKGNHEGVSFMLAMFATSLCSTHKHEDDLSFTLFFDGIEWLTDPSFFSHDYALPIPAYLRSAAAHNVLSLSGRNYSIAPGSAMLRGYQAGDEFMFFGKHHAYEDMIVHRELRGRITSLDFHFNESITGFQGAPDAVVWRLHCGDGVRAVIADRMLTLSHESSKYQLDVELPCDNAHIIFDVTDGKHLGGIAGTTFMKYQPINTIECRSPVNCSLKWRITGRLRRSDEIHEN
jgi:hypothetical protein